MKSKNNLCFTDPRPNENLLLVFLREADLTKCVPTVITHA